MNRRFNFEKVARGLTAASFGLGLVELFFPGHVQKLVGVRRGDYTPLIRAAGAREVASGLLIAMQPRPHTGMWSRVAGDVVDLASLAGAYNLRRSDKDRVLGVAAAIAGLTAIDVLTAVKLGRDRAEEKRYSSITRQDLNNRARGGAFHVLRSITINRSPEELYSFWRRFERLPQFMYHLEAVDVLDATHSHWVAKAPAGTTVEWDAEITEDRPNELIAWRSTEGASVPNWGQVRFKPAPRGRGTEVQVEVEYRPPGGGIGKAVAFLFGEEPAQQISGDLRRFKQVMETGEVVKSEGSPRGMGQKMQRPARPLSQKNLDKLEREREKEQKRNRDRLREQERKETL